MVQAQDIERVIGANGNLDFGNGPAEFDSRGTVKNTIGRAQQKRLCGAQPIREQPARSEIEKAGRLGSATERDTIFGVRGSEEIRAGATIPSASPAGANLLDRKSTRLNSSHGYISYAVFCLKKKKQ